MTGVPTEGGSSVTLDLLKQKMAEFAKERDWTSFIAQEPPSRYDRRAEVGEVGEVSEIFQWKGEVPKGLLDWKDEEKFILGKSFQMLLYLVRLSDICGIDLGKVALRKLQLNAIKYPATVCTTSTTTTPDLDR
ncbi:dCTP pyrophosphatase 1 [Senna tora]|uniref:dCTP pyrophosphatase 1 n=1 Tax=Senna tora TaxID=362788 RepID=A0A834TNC0_9FABA|nr:dCTP pyrophosphatase 1 [Senna tora]